jgi:hypothetical protein
MQLTYDDTTRKFIFDIESPLEDVLDLSDYIEVSIDVEGGIGAFPRAYSIAKYFERGIDNIVTSTMDAIQHFDEHELRKKMIDVMRQSEEFIAQSDAEHANGNMPDDMREVITEGSHLCIEACTTYLEMPRDELLDKLHIIELQLKDASGNACFTLPGIPENLLFVPFTFNIPDISTEIQRAMVQRESAGSLH